MKLINAKYALLWVLALAVTFTSCKEDEEEEPTPILTNTQKLTGNEWVLSSYTVEPALDWDGNGTTESNILPLVAGCDADDALLFRSNLTYQISEGETKCDINDPQVYETGTWAFDASESLISTTDEDGDIYEYPIESLSEAQFVVTRVFQLDGVNYTFTETYR